MKTHAIILYVYIIVTTYNESRTLGHVNDFFCTIDLRHQPPTQNNNDLSKSLLLERLACVSPRFLIVFWLLRKAEDDLRTPGTRRTATLLLCAEQRRRREDREEKVLRCWSFCQRLWRRFFYALCCRLDTRIQV